jgi:hypothetical protein
MYQLTSTRQRFRIRHFYPKDPAVNFNVSCSLACCLWRNAIKQGKKNSYGISKIFDKLGIIF